MLDPRYAANESGLHACAGDAAAFAGMLQYVQTTACATTFLV